MTAKINPAAAANGTKEDRTAAARAIIAACGPTTGTTGETYLAGRGIDAAAIPDGIVGWHAEKRAMVWTLLDGGAL